MLLSRLSHLIVQRMLPPAKAQVHSTLDHSHTGLFSPAVHSVSRLRWPAKLGRKWISKNQIFAKDTPPPTQPYTIVRFKVELFEVFCPGGSENSWRTTNWWIGALQTWSRLGSFFGLGGKNLGPWTLVLMDKVDIKKGTHPSHIHLVRMPPVSYPMSPIFPSIDDPVGFLVPTVRKWAVCGPFRSKACLPWKVFRCIDNVNFWFSLQKSSLFQFYCTATYIMFFWFSEI